MRPLNNIPQFVSPNHFAALWMTTDDNDKESDEQLIQDETDWHLLNQSFQKLKV